jgi:hypothetical protein
MMTQTYSRRKRTVDQLNEVIEPKKKSGVLKWILIGCGSLLVLVLIIIGIGAYFASRVFTLNPVKVETVAQEILSFDKPQGFQGAFSMSIAGMRMVTLIGTEGTDLGSTIVLASLPPGSTQASMEQNITNAMEQRGKGKMHIVETRPPEDFQAQGQTTPAVVNLVEQSGYSGQRMLQYVMTLRGPSGNSVVLMMMGHETSTSHERVQQFLDTVR